MVGASSFYTPPSLTPEEGCRGYLRFLQRRDGRVDPAAGTLSHREPYLEALDRLPVRLGEPLTPARLEAALRRGRRAPTPPPLALAVALVRGAEVAGPDPGRRRAEALDPETPTSLSCRAAAATYVGVEIRCRARLLAGAVRYFGAPAPELPAPGGAARLWRRAAPGSAGLWAFAGSVGVAYRLHTLLGATGRVLAREPAVRDAVEERLVLALTDAVGHVAFHRLGLGRAGQLAARPAGALACRRIRSSPALRTLGGLIGGPEDPGTFDLPLLPAEVRRQAFFV